MYVSSRPQPTTLVIALFSCFSQVEEEFEIDLNDNEPEFLRGQTQKTGVEMSPIKRAAMTQVRMSVACKPLWECSGSSESCVSAVWGGTE